MLEVNKQVKYLLSMLDSSDFLTNGETQARKNLPGAKLAGKRWML